ncbi:MAG TPA: lipoprotein [Hyphomicrobiaceae bacterium]|nr:lipoprotein [Hyphomicrobiaceae bacterium]
MRSVLRIAALAAAAGLMLGGCGVRGALEAPPEAKKDAEEAKAARSKDPNYKPEHKGFILDGLLR